MMKRLQFRHKDEIFATREEALKYFKDITTNPLNPDITVGVKEKSEAFGVSLYAEPMVAKYKVGEKTHIILAIGVDSGKTPYHIIDSQEIAELINTNKVAIEAEVNRAIEAEKSLSGSIETEIERAKEAELFLSGAIDTEREERIAEDEKLQTQISSNIAKIAPVTENLASNVREEFVLKNANGEELGSHIKIYKDSALVSAKVDYKGAVSVIQKEDGSFEFTYGPDNDKNTEYLYLIYRNEEGGLSLVGLDFENFLLESEAGDGIKFVDHKISIKLKLGEKYLKVSENGLETINIDEAIKNAVDTSSDILNKKIDAEIKRSTEADKYISGITYEFSAATVNEINSLNLALNNEIKRSKEAETFLSGAIDTEREERTKKDKEIDGEISAIKTFNTDIDKKLELEITRSTEKDNALENQILTLSEVLETEMTNREIADESIRTNFANADLALGNRIDGVISDNAATNKYFNSKLDEEIGNRISGDTQLSNVIDAVSDRLTLIEQDHLVNEDKHNIFISISGVQNAVASAQTTANEAKTTANEAKTKIDGFMAAANIGGNAIDTLIEIQQYINVHGEAASEMLNKIGENATNIRNEITRATGVEEHLSGSINTEIARAKEAEHSLEDAITNEKNRATDKEAELLNSLTAETTRATTKEEALERLITAEITNRRDADDAVRKDFANADTALRTDFTNADTLLNNSITTLSQNITNEINRATTEDKALEDAITAETNRATNKEAELLKSLTAETTRATTKEEALENLITAEETRAEKVEQDLSAKITAETTRATDKEAELSNALAAETKSRKDDEIKIRTDFTGADTAIRADFATADTQVRTDFAAADTQVRADFAKADLTLSNRIDKIEGDLNTELSTRGDAIKKLESSISEISAALQVETTERKNNDNDFEAKITTLESQVTDSKGKIDTFLANANLTGSAVSTLTEIQKYITNDGKAASEMLNKIGENTTNISNETTRATGVEGQLSSSINTEIARATTKDKALEDAITTETNRAKEAEADLKTAILEEKARAQTEELKITKSNADLTTEVNAEKLRVNTITGETIPNIRKDIIEISGSVISNKNAITTLNNTKGVAGSVLNTIGNEFGRLLITDGLPSTKATLEEAKKVHSLMREVKIGRPDGGQESAYFVSANADEMYYVKPDGNLTNLNQYIKSLEDKITTLEATIGGINSNLTQTVQNIVKQYIKGTNEEIKVVPEVDSLRIGFADNAIFGTIL